MLVFPTDGPRIKSWSLRGSLVDSYQETYPALDVLAECRRALLWIESNPVNRKTAGGMKAFLTKWLNRSQNRIGAITNGRAPQGAGVIYDPNAKGGTF